MQLFLYARFTWLVQLSLVGKKDAIIYELTITPDAHANNNGVFKVKEFSSASECI